MNKNRRAKIEVLIAELGETMAEIETIADEEEEYKDNIPENLQGSEKYQTAEYAVDNLRSAFDQVQEAIDSLQSAVEG